MYVGQPGLLGAGISPGALSLSLHEDAEAVLIDLNTLLSGHLQGQVDRKPVGVVQGEGAVAGQDRPAGPALGVGHRRVQDGGARGQGAAEGILLGVGDLGDGGPARSLDRKSVV